MQIGDGIFAIPILSLALMSGGGGGKPLAVSVSQVERKQSQPQQQVLAEVSITSEATVAEMDPRGNMTVLRPGTNDWVCVPGDQNIVGWTDMCLDPMGMVWLKDLLARKPKPTNKSPGLIYMLNGATQHSYSDPI